MESAQLPVLGLDSAGDLRGADAAVAGASGTGGAVVPAAACALSACAVCGAAFAPKRRTQILCGAEACQKVRYHPPRTNPLPERTCSYCGEKYRPRIPLQVTCGGRVCHDRRTHQLGMAKAAYIAGNRAHARAWQARQDPDHGSNPWLLGEPPHDALLPGLLLTMEVHPAPRWPVELRNARLLHGMATAIIGEDHDHLIPGFALVPSRATRFGWSVLVRNPVVARTLAGNSMWTRLAEQRVQVFFGRGDPIVAPCRIRRGHRRVEIATMTPVCVRSHRATGEAVFHTHPTAESLVSALVQYFPARLGLSIPHESIRLELVSHETEPAHVPLAGKYGVVHGWEGRCVVEGNAVARWLLACAALVGLGGRTAFGLGRVGVRDVE